MVSNMIVLVHGYITSSANYMPRQNKQGLILQMPPFLCITNFQVCSHCCRCPARTAASATTLLLPMLLSTVSSSSEYEFLDRCEQQDDADADAEDLMTMTMSISSSSNQRHGSNSLRAAGAGQRQPRQQQRRTKIPLPASIKSGTIGSFAEMYFPYITDDELLGKFCIPAIGFRSTGLIGEEGTSSSTAISNNTDGNHPATVNTTPLNEVYAQKIADFISHYRAKVMLLSSSSSSTPSSSIAATTTAKEEKKDENSLGCATLGTCTSTIINLNGDDDSSISTMRMSNNHHENNDKVQNNDDHHHLRHHQRKHDRSNKNHIKAVSTFASAQLKRQSASLISNTGREGAKTSELIVKQYSMALSKAIDHATSSSSALSSSSSSSSQKKQQQSIQLQPQLTKEVLCQWHHILGNNNIIPSAG